jgi:PIN domain nuclease of toxin-antitoxin system
MEDSTSRVYVSSIMITEIAIKASWGKLELGFDPIDAIEILALRRWIFWLKMPCY